MSASSRCDGCRRPFPPGELACNGWGSLVVMASKREKTFTGLLLCPHCFHAAANLATGLLDTKQSARLRVALAHLGEHHETCGWGPPKVAEPEEVTS